MIDGLDVVLAVVLCDDLFILGELLPIDDQGQRGQDD